MGMLPHGGGIEGGSADSECRPLNAERCCGSGRGVCMAKWACPVWIRKHQHNCAPGAAKQLPATQMPHAPIASLAANRPTPPPRRANPGFGVPPRTARAPALLADGQLHCVGANSERDSDAPGPAAPRPALRCRMQTQGPIPTVAHACSHLAFITHRLVTRQF